MWRRPPNSAALATTTHRKSERVLMQRKRVEAESIIHNYYNSSTKPKFHKNTRLVGKIIEKTISNKLLLINT